MADEAKITGVWTVVLKDKNGKVKSKQTGKNLVVNGGFGYFATRVATATPGALHPQHVSIGSGTAPPVATQTALGSQLGARIVGVQAGVGNELQVAATVPGPGAGTYTVNEVGIHFMAAGAGNMIARFLIQQVIMSPGETLEISWAVRFGP